MLQRLLSLALAALALAACGDGTGPRRRTLVDVQVSALTPPEYREVGLGQIEISCQATFRATASGGGEASWNDAVFRYFAGVDRSEAVDTTIVDAGTIGQSWDGAIIAAGDTTTATWIFASTATFAVEVIFRYETEEGEERETKASFSCGEVPGAELSVTAIQLVDPSAELEPGTSFQVTYSASGSAGIVWSRLTFSGPCTKEGRLYEPGTTTLTRTVYVALPSTCRLDVPYAITVEVLDGSLQRASRSLAEGKLLVDVTPPTIEASFYAGGAGVPLPGTVWRLFEGELLTMHAEARDNAGVAMLAWEVDPVGVRDSMAVSGTTARENVPLIVSSAWQSAEIRLRARDHGGLWSSPFTVPAGRIAILPTITATIRSTQIEGDAAAMAIDERRGVVYLAQRDQRRIAVLSLATMAVAGTIPLPAIPNDLDLLPGGDSLIVTYQPTRAVALIDLTGEQPAVTEIPLILLDPGAEQVPVYVRVAANRKAFISYVGWGGGDRVMELDLVTGAQRTRPDLANGGPMGTVELERSHDASTILFTNGRLHRYDVTSDAWTAGAQTLGLGRVSIDADGSTILHGRHVYDASSSPVTTFPFFGIEQSGSVISPDGELAWFDIDPRGLLRGSIASATLVDRVAGASYEYRPASFKRVSPDGSMLVLVERGTTASRVTVIAP